MDETVLVFNQTSSIADTIEKMYESPASGAGTRVTAFTASNDTTTSHSYKAYIFNSAGGLEKAIVPQTIVVRDRVDFGSSIVNQLIPAGGTLRVESSDAGSISFYVSGIEN
jgi:hypothetical protein